MPILQIKKIEAQRGEVTCRHSHNEGVVASACNYYPLHYHSQSLKKTPLLKSVFTHLKSVNRWLV